MDFEQAINSHSDQEYTKLGIHPRGHSLRIDHMYWELSHISGSNDDAGHPSCEEAKMLQIRRFRYCADCADGFGFGRITVNEPAR